MAADYRQLARQAAQRHGLNPDIFERQIQQESGFNPHARSPAGALGIAQIMPATARGWGVDPMNPKAALDAAARNMAQYVRQYGGYRNALVAYNAGPGRVGKPLFAETKHYIDTILGGRGEPNAAPKGGVGGVHSKKPIPGFSVDITSPTETETFDEAGFEDAKKKSILGAYLAKKNPHSGLLRHGVLSTKAPDPGDFTTTELGTKTEKFQVPGSEGSSASRGGLAATATERANIIDSKKMPYLWGGGHGAKITDVRNATPLDCSGAVSAVLGIDPRVSGGFTKWGRPGEGGPGQVTVYANSEHVLMRIGDRFFGTSKSNPGGGAGWIPASSVSKEYLSRFTARHSAR